MLTKYFLRGYFYGLFRLYTQTHNLNNDNNASMRMSIEMNLMRIYLFTQKGNLTFMINRGISHVDGNLVLPVFENYMNLFDFYQDWASDEVLDVIAKWVFDTENHVESWEDCREIRLGFDEMCQIIDLCGGLDFDKTIQRNIEMFNTTFKDKSLKI